jgi:hypothetical protein
MRPPPIAVPGLLPLLAAAPCAATPELALDLYRRLAASARAAEDGRRQARQEVERHTREAGNTLARLAAARFEFGRLLARILPALAAGAAGASASRVDVAGLLELFARGWDAELERAAVEVRELTGLEMSDELAAVTAVEAAVPDPGIARAVVRETLSPLVLWAGRVVGVAQVITAVPVAPTPDGGAEPPPRPEEQT